MCADIEVALIIEPDARVLLTRVLYVKDTPNGCLVLFDVGRNDMMRIVLYCVVFEKLWLMGERIVPKLNPECAMSWGRIAVRPINSPGPSCCRQALKRAAWLAVNTTGTYGTGITVLYKSRRVMEEVFVSMGVVGHLPPIDPPGYVLPTLSIGLIRVIWRSQCLA